VETLILILIIGVIAGIWYFNKQKEIQRQAERSQKRGEKKRIEACAETILYFHNNLGYIVKDCISRSELANMLDRGYTAETLKAEIMARINQRDGMTLGFHSLAGGQINAKLLPEFRERHIYIIGKSGSGKTNLIRNLIAQDLDNGEGIGVIAPESEMLTDEILPYIPDHRINDVIYVNPADTERPICFNPLHLDEGEDIDLKADETYSIFQRLMGAGGGERMNAILRYTLYALLERPKTTLLDIEPLLDRSSRTFRDMVIRDTTDPETRHFFRDVYPSFPKDSHLPIVGRLSRLTRPKYVRNILCNPDHSLNFREAMDTGKILLFNLSDGILGEANSQTLGQLVVSKFQMATMSRASQPKGTRRPFWLYIDEFQTFVDTSSASYEKILSRARKYKLGLILAHQQTRQIPQDLLREIFGNVSTMISFVVSSADASALSKEFITDTNGEIGNISAQQILSLKVGEAYCKIGQTSFFMNTYLADQHPSFERARQVIEYSRRTYGAKPTGSYDYEQARPKTPETSKTQTDPEQDAFQDFDPEDLFGE